MKQSHWNAWFLLSVGAFIAILLMVSCEPKKYNDNNLLFNIAGIIVLINMIVCVIIGLNPPKDETSS